MGFLGAFNMFSCLVDRQKVSQMNRSVELSLLQLLRAGFLQSYLGNAAPHQLCRAHSRSAVLVGSLPLSCPEMALAARMGPAVGTSAPALTLGPRGWVHACGGTWDHSLHRMQADLALLLPLWSVAALVLPPLCADFPRRCGLATAPTSPCAAAGPHVSSEPVV